VFRSERYEAVFAFFSQFRMVPRAFRSSPFATFFAPTSYSTDVTTDGFKLFVDGETRLRVVMGTRLGTASPALSLNPIMAQGRQISSERPLRPMMP
jgi:hypothetical protein